MQKSDAPDLGPICRRHERAGRRHRRAAIAMAAGGALLAVAGMWLPGAPELAALVVGLLVAALAAVPLARSFELRERAEGLSFLEEEWRAAAASDAKKAGQAFAALIARLYQRPARG